MTRQWRGTELPWLLGGRRIKPLAAAAVLWCVGAAIGPLSGGENESFDFDSTMGWAESTLSAAAVALLIVSWLAVWQRMVEAALLLTAAVFAARAVLAVLDVGLLHPATWIAAGCAVGAGGAYLLERAERIWPDVADRRHGAGGRE